MPVEEEEREVKISDYYYKKSDIDTQMSNKVDKDGSKVLSDNNYTNADKTKLTNMTPADYVTSQSLSSILSSYVVTSTLNNYYTQSEIDNIISTKISKSTTVGLVKNDGTIDTTTYLTTHQDISGKENLSNKVSSWSGTTSNTHYPSEKLVKDSLDNKINTSDIVDNVTTNDATKVLSAKQGKILSEGISSASSGLGQAINGIYSNFNNYQIKDFGSANGNQNVVTNSSGIITIEPKPTVPTKTSDLTNDGSDGTHSFISSDDSRLTDARTPTTHGHGNISSTGFIGGAGGKPLITEAYGKITTGSFGTTSGTFAEGNHTHSQYLTSHQSLSDIGGTVTIEKQQTAESGYIATYVIKQGGIALSPKINIPKDYLVKSASIGTCSTADSPVAGYVVGDKYLDFVINTKDSSETDEHLYILISDLITTSDDNKEDKSNKSSSITTDTGSTTKYPTVKAVEDYAVQKIPMGDLYGVSSNSTSLQKQIQDASSGGTIVLDKDYLNNSNATHIILSNKNITIIGDGHIIDGNSKLINFIASGTTTLKISNCVFQNITLSAAQLLLRATDSAKIIIDNCIFKNIKVKAYSGIINTDQSTGNYDYTNAEFKILNSSFLSISGNTFLNFCDTNFSIINTIFENNTINSILVNNTSSTNFTQEIINCVFNNNYPAITDSSTGVKSLVLKNNHFLQSGDTVTGCVNNNYLTAHQDISGKANTVDLSDVAISGSYDDLTDKPTIPIVPTNVSDFTNDSGYLTSQDISGKEDINNKVTSLSSSSTDTQYPSAKLVYDNLNNKIDASNVDTMTATINYTDNTSETVTFYIVPNNNSS